MWTTTQGAHRMCMRYTIQNCRTVLFKECSARIILYYFISLTVRTRTTVDVCLFMHAVLFYVCEMGTQYRHFTVLLVPFGMKNSKGDQRPGSANEQQKCRYVFLCPKQISYSDLVHSRLWSHIAILMLQVFFRVLYVCIENERKISNFVCLLSCWWHAVCAVRVCVLWFFSMNVELLLALWTEIHQWCQRTSPIMATLSVCLHLVSVFILDVWIVPLPSPVPIPFCLVWDGRWETKAEKKGNMHRICYIAWTLMNFDTKAPALWCFKHSSNAHRCKQPANTRCELERMHRLLCLYM